MKSQKFDQWDRYDSFFAGGLLAIGAVLICLALSSCAGREIAQPQSEGFGVIGISLDKTGFIISPEKRDDLVSRNVPSGWFVAQGGNYYLSAQHEAQAASILLRERNP